MYRYVCVCVCVSTASSWKCYCSIFIDEIANGSLIIDLFDNYLQMACKDFPFMEKSRMWVFECI